MKSILFSLCLLFLGLTSFGQSIKFNDLVYFTNLTNGEVTNTLRQGKAFKQDYTMTVNGQELAYFKNIGSKPNTEKITVGSYVKLHDGTLLRTVNYTSTGAQNILSMISQAKKYGLVLKFQGADPDNNIYLYDNDFFHVSIYLRRDQTSGMVEVKQREFSDVQ